ncbi:YkvA family protein [Dehalobacterium formicoaceticum]|uniref:YkvA family protein n=1 Tax=Dehalobacterium formicoaceticum TaxID=51515 RepID=UPI000B7F99BC|nr:YkvA family protein [Dehalobacterium formicoaceticum]
MNINFEDVKAKFGDKAKEYANDKNKAKKLVYEAMKKANQEKGKKGPIDDVWEKIQLLFGLVKDWATGEYKDVPIKSIVIIIVAILYFLNPIDLIPDAILGIGLADDAFVLGLVFKQVSCDLETYEAWLKCRGDALIATSAD